MHRMVGLTVVHNLSVRPVAVLPKLVLQPWVALHCTLITTLEYPLSGTASHTVLS